jgi:hypothetical protein
MEHKQHERNRPLMLVLAFVALLIPGVRRFIFYRLLKSRTIRTFGLQAILSIPFLRERLMNKVLPSKSPY